jgi:hypothetical protein
MPQGHLNDLRPGQVRADGIDDGLGISRCRQGAAGLIKGLLPGHRRLGLQPSQPAGARNENEPR